MTNDKNRFQFNKLVKKISNKYSDQDNNKNNISFSNLDYELKDNLDHIPSFNKCNLYLFSYK